MIKNKKRQMLTLQIFLIIFGVLGILLINSSLMELAPPCTIKKYVGIICPTCGVTRCVRNMASFKFDVAFMYHPMFFLGMCYLAVVDVLYVINTLFDKKILKCIYPSLKILTVFYILFFAQYFYRLYMIINHNAFEFL